MELIGTLVLVGLLEFLELMVQMVQMGLEYLVVYQVTYLYLFPNLEYQRLGFLKVEYYLFWILIQLYHRFQD